MIPAVLNNLSHDALLGISSGIEPDENFLSIGKAFSIEKFSLDNLMNAPSGHEDINNSWNVRKTSLGRPCPSNWWILDVLCPKDTKRSKAI